MVNAYSALANHGRLNTPTLIDYVQDRNGKVVFRTDRRCEVMEEDNGGACNTADWDGTDPVRDARPSMYAAMAAYAG